MLARLDPQRPRQRLGADPGILDRYLGGLRMPVRGATGAGHAPVLLAIAERITGVSLTPESLDLPHLLVRFSADGRPIDR